MATKNLSSQISELSNKKLPPSSQAEIDQALAVLSANKDAWAMMDIPGRIALLDQIKLDMPKVEERWMAVGIAAKESRPETFDVVADQYSFTVIYRYLRFMRKALQDIQQYGKPKIPGKVSTRTNGQVVAQVMPYDWKEASACQECVLKSGWTHLFPFKMAVFHRLPFTRKRTEKDRFAWCLVQAM